MKRIKIIALLLFCTTCAFAQTMYDYKTKTNNNKIERTKMLDLLRSAGYTEFKQEFVFEVLEFNVSNNYAWLKANAQKNNGGEIKLADGDFECCHVEALFVKKNKKWYVLEKAFFASDVWWQGIWNQYPKAPVKIFGDAYFKE